MKQQWSSKLAFILAAAGSAVGLGAIWKFPYVTGTSGGGAFFLIFILFTLLIGLPLLIGEFVIGRSTQKNAIESYRAIAPNSSWGGVGKLGIFTCFLLLSFYSVIGGWIIIYFLKAITGQLSGLDEGRYGEIFAETISNPILAISSQFAFLAIVMYVVSRGVKKGIERASVIMMPALFVLFLAIVIRGLTLDGATEGLAFFLVPDFSTITSETLLYAMGQSFFALSVGVSVMVTYSSYLSRDESIVQSALSIVMLTFVVAFLAGVAIFPAVFSFGMSPDEGPVLLFNVLPSVFDQMPYGAFFLVTFLLLFLFATLTSAFSMLEVVVAAITKGDVSQRPKVTWLIGLAIFAVGIPSALSYGVWSDVLLFGRTVFDTADFLVSNILMPIGALLIAIFVPLKISKERLYEEIKAGASIGKRLFAIWFILIRYVAPIVIAIVFLDVIGALSFISAVAGAVFN
ncbi:sodium-dependent transporter [Halalkalibacterium halodurans]|jgi:NSS family neurotransmitter:Na+ symporter|uniref:Transporter n=2 Tax=Halalkalibacterium halodurans TaxID=86665 RepID=Q9KG95_HALH5|nr:sodium-dependent transporter [Halalkalibacterium halodurans]MED4081316.1 sodium-dependent transporter [Halalkalibacterium halodurans]MED4084031.1 sodium-dependent transporter [Halalkalibacterium halodurans]MED4105964.1 sodium-dependent transporter [Halalkalibacterium halodurans]MED4107362.1 sodium-dependent transporter [Halalkalibacterium halodurans]MED4125900.1 sodium-dependent transporter [Halalkalibacterium halodurans]